MAAFPSFLLLAFAGLSVIPWSRPAPWRVGAVIAASLGSSLSLLLVDDALPLTSRLSVWRPVALFGEGLLLTLDDPIWPVALVVCALPLIAVLSRVGTRPLEGLEAAAVLATSGLALAAVLAGNLLTLMVVWSLMGAARLAWAVLTGSPEQGVMRAATQEAAPPLLLMLAGFLDQLAGGQASLSAPASHAASAVVLLLAILLKAAPVAGMAKTEGRGSRAATGQPPVGSPDRPGRPLVDGLSFQLLPAVAALAALGRLSLHQVPPDSLVWSGLFGLLALLSGLVGWLAGAPYEQRVAWLAWSLMGAGMLAAGSGLVALALAALLLLVGGLQAAQQLQQPWQRVWPALGFLAAAGAPGLPGAGVALALSLQASQGPGTWIVVTLGMVGVAAGVWHRSNQGRADAPGAAVRGADFACLALLLTALWASVRQGWIGSDRSWILAGAIAGLAGAGSWLRPHLARLQSGPPKSLRPSVVAAWAETAIRRLIAAVGQVVAAVAGLFEGRAGVLWMFLVVLVAWLALRI